jgi:hypothetical protein
MRIFLFGLLLFALMGIKSQSSAQSNAGFSEAVFNVQTINNLLARGSSDSIRFYTVLDNGSVNVMAIPTAGGKDETGGLFTWKPYVVSKGIASGAIVENKVSTGDANQMCKNNAQSANKYFITDFAKADILRLINIPNCNALKITPDTNSKNKTTTAIQAAEFNGRTAASLGSKLIDQDPCPPLCLAPANYVYL